jgi:hypothetical protein
LLETKALKTRFSFSRRLDFLSTKRPDSHISFPSFLNENGLHGATQQALYEFFIYKKNIEFDGRNEFWLHDAHDLLELRGFILFGDVATHTAQT